MVTALGTNLGKSLGTRLGLGSGIDPLTATLPDHQFRADTVTLSGGNVATIPNRRGTDFLSMVGGTLAAPVADGSLNGAPSIAFTGTQYLASNLPVASWEFMQTGLGFEVFSIYVPTDLTGVHVLVATRTGGNGVSMYTDGVQQAFYVFQGSAMFSLSSAGTHTLNSPTYSNYLFKKGNSPEWASYLKSTLLGSGAANVPGAGVPQNVLTLGANGSGGSPTHCRWAETLLYKRALSAADRLVVRTYISTRYGIA